MSESTPRRDYLNRWGQLKAERSSWESHWKDLSDVILPRNGRFFVDDRNRGQKRHNAIYDSTATRALRVLSAGMMAGMTSPARPWFRLTTPDPSLTSYEPVKEWLHQVTRLMLDVYARSNTYRALHQMYEELGIFGTAASIVMPDRDDVIRHATLTVGEYAIQQDWRGQVVTLYREFQKTVGEIVKEFGYDRCSTTVKNLFDRGSLESCVTIVHCIEPRADRDSGKRDNKNMPWKSVYFEIGADDGAILRESGYESFPALCPRWAVSGGDIYGSSPAMESLGDIRQLQHEQLRKAQAIDYKTNPPLQVPTAYKTRDIDRLPGGVIYVDAANAGMGVRSAFEVNLDLSHLREDIQDVRGRINSAFYADLFLMLASGANTNMTATEVAERHEEKMLMLGPVLERLHNELLDPLVEMTFARLLQAGVLPPPPKELQGIELNVEFVSMLAQAQRAIGTNSVDRFVGNMGMIAQMKPDVLDKFDSDRWADEYADMLGVSPSLIIGNDEVALVRQQRAEAAQAQAQAQAAEQQAAVAQRLGAVDTSKQSALTDVMGAFSGYT